jgi:hypothetical protein
MRMLWIGIGLWAALTYGSTAIAQSQGQQLYEKDKDEVRPGVHQLTPAERVHERAALEAQARLNRIESRRALGISLQRPSYDLAPSFNQPVLHVAPWGIYGTCGVPYTVWLP